jgi:hypothetical protein
MNGKGRNLTIFANLFVVRMQLLDATEKKFPARII